MRYLKIWILLLGFMFPLTVQASVYDLSFDAIDGTPMPLDQFKGKVMLVAVTATQCGNTHQFGPLQTLWEQYRDKGLVVVGVPTNDFGLEPRKEAEIKEFCETNFNAQFPMTTLSHVVGQDMHPFFQQVVTDLGVGALPGWNFFKYLVDQEGRVIKVFATRIDPLSDEVKAEIEKALGI